MHRKILPVMVFVFLLSLAGGAAFAASGGLSGTGDSDFDPASDTEGNHCVNGLGVDLNDLLGVSEQFVIGGGCTTVNSGEFYIPGLAVWVTNKEEGLPGLPVVYPQGYTPVLPAPMDDFLSKLVSVKYTVDGRKQYVFPAEDIVKILTLGTKVFPPFYGVDPDETPLAIFIAKLHPAAVGVHTVQMRLVLSAEHCDGLGTVEFGPIRDLNCLQSGENLRPPAAGRVFEVVPGAAQSQ